MTKDHAQGVFIRFIDFRGELLLRASTSGTNIKTLK